jgi:hypothetical protein
MISEALIFLKSQLNNYLKPSLGHGGAGRGYDIGATSCEAVHLLTFGETPFYNADYGIRICWSLTRATALHNEPTLHWVSKSHRRASHPTRKRVSAA